MIILAVDARPHVRVAVESFVFDEKVAALLRSSVVQATSSRWEPDNMPWAHIHMAARPRSPVICVKSAAADSRFDALHEECTRLTLSIAVVIQSATAMLLHLVPCKTSRTHDNIFLGYVVSHPTLLRGLTRHLAVVLDLDETLVHCHTRRFTGDASEGWVPHGPAWARMGPHGPAWGAVHRPVSLTRFCC